MGAFFALLSMQTAYSQTCAEIPNSKRCVDQTPCKDTGGILACLSWANLPQGAARLPQSCWQFSYDYACESSSVNTCGPYENNKACTIVGSRCNDIIVETGKCSEYTNTYSCIIKEAIKEKKLACSTDVFNTASFTKPENTNNTFSKAALASEILRQSGTYNKDGLNIFSGVSETCRKGYAGIKNCCKAKPGATSNSAMMSLTMGAGASVVKYAGAVAVDMASPYVFDAMYAGGEYAAGLAMEMAGSSANVVYDFATEAVGTNFAAGGPSLSAYGFTYQSGTAAAGSGVFGANTTLVTFGEGSSMTSMTSITFNPYVFGAMVAIAVIQELASCSKEEQMLALHKGASLSTYVTQWCSKSILGVCVERTESYCSFNSVLAKIVNTQGKPQIGLQIADCKGLSTDQISKLDFTKIDFSEFTSQIADQAAKNLPTGINKNYTPVMSTKNSGSQQGSSPVNPVYPPAPALTPQQSSSSTMQSSPNIQQMINAARAASGSIPK